MPDSPEHDEDSLTYAFTLEDVNEMFRRAERLKHGFAADDDRFTLEMAE